jgi:adenosylcobinamide-phosphate synthase
MDLAESTKLALLAVAIEAFVGYPQKLFHLIGHPVSWIGQAIAFADRKFNNKNRAFAQRLAAGAAALALLLAVTACTAFFIPVGLAAAGLPAPAALILTALAASSLIAQQSLAAHVLAVATRLERGLPGGRAAVAKIVGRNVEGLDASGIASAAIESLAENYSDAVVAPAFWLALGGLPAGACYKAINTADSMIGHRAERYAAFGFAAAKLDDLVNFCPARLSALWIIIASLFTKGASAKNACRAVRRDTRGHPSPNAPWPEAAFAGALGLRLGGPRSYGGIAIDDAWIGTGARACPSDILRALALYRRACAVHWFVLAIIALAIARV